MTSREFRWLGRRELIEIIYELRRSELELQEEVAELKKQLEERRIYVERAGSLAELSASLNGLFEAAQATAEQYLEALRTMKERAEAPEPEEDSGQLILPEFEPEPEPEQMKLDFPEFADSARKAHTDA